MANLESGQIVGAITGNTVESILEPLLSNLRGDTLLFDEKACGVRARGYVRWNVANVDLRLDCPHIVFEDWEVDTWPGIRLNVDFNDLYNCLDNYIFLPPLCWEVCAPFTDICWEECIDLGSASTGRIEIPIPLDLTGFYKPEVDKDAGKFTVFPRLDYITPLVVDAGRLIELVCRELEDLLPWPIDAATGWLCRNFAQLFDFIENFVNAVTLNLVKWLFDETKGWIGLELKFVKLYEVDRKKFPGTGTGPGNPAIPVRIDSLDVEINSADELQLALVVDEAN